MPLEQLLVGIGVLAAAGGVWALALTMRPSNREKEFREQLATLAAQLEKCKVEKERMSTALTDAELKIKQLEAALEEQKKRLERRCEARLEEQERKLMAEFAKERARLREEYEKRIEEVARVSRAAATLFEALKARKVRVVVPGRACTQVIVEPERILCRKADGSLEPVWPESEAIGEALVVETEEKEGQG